VLLVLVLRGGVVKQQMLNLLEPSSQEMLNDASDRLNQLLSGLSTEEIEARVSELPNFEAEIATITVNIMNRANAQTAGIVYRDGLSEVLQQPEFAEGEQAQGLVRVMEEHSFLETVLTDALSPEVGSVQVLIGGEGRWDELQACSLVLARYGVTGLITGALGILGPTRMSYGRAISTVRYVAGLLSDLVYDTYVES
jgi:heat-inducible transcriptional repressor